MGDAGGLVFRQEKENEKKGKRLFLGVTETQYGLSGPLRQFEVMDVLCQEHPTATTAASLFLSAMFPYVHRRALCHPIGQRQVTRHRMCPTRQDFFF